MVLKSRNAFFHATTRAGAIATKLTSTCCFSSIRSFRSWCVTGQRRTYALKEQKTKNDQPYTKLDDSSRWWNLFFDDGILLFGLRSLFAVFMQLTSLGDVAVVTHTDRQSWADSQQQQPANFLTLIFCIRLNLRRIRFIAYRWQRNNRRSRKYLVINMRHRNNRNG